VALMAGTLFLGGGLLREPRAWPVLLAPLLLALVWFWLKTRDGRRSLRWLGLLGITLVSWHWGLLTAMTGSRNQAVEKGPRPGVFRAAP
jgi:hypothetical protein